VDLGISSPSSPRAASWRLTSTALFDVKVTAIAIDPRSPDTIYVGGYTGGGFHQRVALFRSDDAGLTWRQIQNGLSGMSGSFRVNPTNPDVLYAGTFGGGVFKSVDRGESWARLTVGQLPWVGSLVMDERNPDALYVSIGGDGNYKTTDAGNTWTLFDGPPGIPGVITVWQFLSDPSTDGRLYAVDSHRLFRSDDAGASWHLVRDGIQSLLWIDPSDSAVLYAIGELGGLLKSTDRGSTWTVIGSGLPMDVSLGTLVSDPANPSILHVGTMGHGVFRSTDAGLTWSAFNEGMTNRSVGPLLIPASRNPLLYAGTDSGLYDYRARAEFQVTLPAVASLHGVPPAFFHSDVWIFNGSAESEATVTATYRCLIGTPCSGSPRTFTIPSRQVKTFRDIVVTLFDAPETAGAVEFESDRLIVVTSRLYTPDSSHPTTGMFVPGLKSEQAGSYQVLTSLSHSEDATTGFRTNVGFYNGTDSGTFVSLAFFEASGVNLGEIIVFGYPRRPLQLNDAEIFQRLGISRDVPNFFCVVTAYPNETPIRSYAAVIDNRSLDPIFVPGQDAAAMPEAKVTVPAVAAIRGAGGTFFHSDVRIWNASSAFAEVIARFACFEKGDCGERVFIVGPRQVLAFDDVVTSLFHSGPEAGAMEFVSVRPLVVTSRLYTPAATEPTVGMFVPGLPPSRASPAVVLNGLSRAADPSSGSRVNVGVFNQADVAQVVTYRLFDGGGSPIAQTARFFGPREAFQVNDIFAFLNVSGAVDSAYCLIEGSELLPLFTYAAIIDNRSQDPIFVPGEDDPEKPPIEPFSP
jgi:photosystem II stability/assembly factor-like uncharacterized protein